MVSIKLFFIHCLKFNRRYNFILLLSLVSYQVQFYYYHSLLSHLPHRPYPSQSPPPIPTSDIQQRLANGKNDPDLQCSLTPARLQTDAASVCDSATTLSTRVRYRDIVDRHVL